MNLGYDAVTLEQFVKNINLSSLLDLRPLPRGPYRSIWRVLHVDGFEDGKSLQMFHYTPMGEFDEKIQA